MSTTDQETTNAQSPLPDNGQLQDEALNRRSTQIAEALELAGDRLPAAAQEQARAELERVHRRLQLGVGHTVVALAGGTGSGKSSLFNAVSGLQFADVGVIRPTTAEAAACIWGGPGTELLDFLGVAPGRRIQRESVLDGDDEQELRGLVLLDLPDHDSVEEGHARQVDRLLPLVDLLIWVVDPQKYADNALHETYLRSLASRQESMLVVVNQVDTIRAETRQAVHDDVARLLAQEGLGQVELMLTSAREREGIASLRERLTQVVATASVSARTARAQLEAAARGLSSHVAPAQPEPEELEATAEQLAVASGVSSVAESVRTAVASPREVILSSLRRPARSRLDAIRDRWLTKATVGLPPRWAQAATAEVPPAENFAADVWSALQRVPLPSGRDGQAHRIRRIGQLVLGLGILALFAGGVLVTLALTGVLAAGPTLGWALAGLGAVSITASVLIAHLARRRRRRVAAQRSDSYLAKVTHELRGVVTADLIEPTTPVLIDHAEVRRALQAR